MATVYIPIERSISARCYVSRPDGETWEDVSVALASVDIQCGDVSSVGTGSTGSDAVSRTANIVLRSNLYDGLGPRDKSSARNRWMPSGSPVYVFAPLLFSGREIIIQTAITELGVAPISTDWRTVFEGVLGDSIKNDGSGRISLLVRDKSKRLMEAFIMSTQSYGSEAGVLAETTIQAILDANMGSGAVTLNCPVESGWMVRPYQVEYINVWDAIQNIAAQMGWYLGYKYDTATDSFLLTLMEPPRTKTASDYGFTWISGLYAEDMDTSDLNIRNAVTVIYRDSAGVKQSELVEDATSIATFGRREMQIEEGSASLIDTAEEAQQLAGAALADLKDLTGAIGATLPYYPELDLFDLVTLYNPRIASLLTISDQPELIAVNSIAHSLRFPDGDSEECTFETTIVGSCKVTGGHGRWLRMETRPGARSPVTGRDIASGIVMPAPAWVHSPPATAGTESVNDVLSAYADLVWAKPQGEYYPASYALSYSVGGGAWTQVQVAETYYRLRGLPLGATVDAKVAGVSVEGVLGTAATLTQFTAQGATTTLGGRGAGAYLYNSFVAEHSAGTYLTVDEVSTPASGVNEYPPSSARLVFGGVWSNAEPTVYYSIDYHLFQGMLFNDGSVNANSYGEYVEITWVQYGTTVPRVDGSIYNGTWSTTPDMALRVYLWSWTGGAWVAREENDKQDIADGYNSLSFGAYTLVNGTTYRMRLYRSCSDAPDTHHYQTYGWTLSHIEVSETVAAGAEVTAISGRQVMIAGQWLTLSGAERCLIGEPTGTQYWRIFLQETSEGQYTLLADGPESAVTHWDGKDFWDPANSPYDPSSVELGRVAWTDSGSPSFVWSYLVLNPYLRWLP